MAPVGSIRRRRGCRRRNRKRRKQSIKNRKTKGLSRASSSELSAKGSGKSTTNNESISSWRGSGNCNRSKCREDGRELVVRSIANEGEERRSSRKAVERGTTV